jgi:U3 small nucleolar RNA-associated protein 21
MEAAEEDVTCGAIISKPKRQKVTHHRSHLAALLEECYQHPVGDFRFQPITDDLASLGPSAIDVSLSTLCSGMLN